MSKITITTLNEFDGGSLLREWGIPVIDGILINNISEATTAAKKLGFPVALKVCSGEIAHKTEQGGVVLNVNSAATLGRAVREMKEKFINVPHALLIQKMARPGTELILGARRDPVFGPVILAGLGGIFTEVFRDTAIDLAPVNIKEAQAMLRSLKGAALLEGYRSQEPMDIMTIARAVSALSRLMSKRPDILEVDVNPFIVYPDGAVAVDALVRLDSDYKRISSRKSDWKTIDLFFNPSSVAVIGASRSPGKGGNTVLYNLLKAGFKGAIYPINPSGKEIMGMQSYARVQDVPAHVDLAVIVIPKSAVPAALDDCAACGIKNIILSTGGYADMGESGIREQKILADLAKRAGIRIMGPNSIGTLNPSIGLANPIGLLEPIETGRISFIAQSGIFSSGWARWIAGSNPFGIAKTACIGNKGDINESDLLEYLTDDEKTSSIGMYLEGIIDGPRFVKAAAKACVKKPVVVMKAGRSEAGAAAIASHTGSLAGSDVVFDAACRKSGLLRAHDSEAFFDAITAFEMLPLPRGNRMGVVSVTGMGCVAATDAAEEYGIVLPRLKPATLKKLSEVMPDWAPVRNPIDTWSAVEKNGGEKAMSHIVRYIMEQNDIDAMLIVLVGMPENMFDFYKAFSEVMKRYPHKPVFASHYGGIPSEVAHVHEGFRKLGVPSYAMPERAIHAFSFMVEYARFRGIIRK
ncbi:MAG: acetate--CoA ligase family protein [Smithella sp.]